MRLFSSNDYCLWTLKNINCRASLNNPPQYFSVFFGIFRYSKVFDRLLSEKDDLSAFVYKFVYI